MLGGLPRAESRVTCDRTAWRRAAARLVDDRERELRRLAGRVQRVSVVSTVFSPGSPAAGTELGERLGLPPGDREVTTVGGNSPQWLVTRAAEQIGRGELGVTLLAGAESTRSARASGAQDRIFRRRDEDSQAAADPVVGTAGDGLLSAAEMAVSTGA